MFRVRARFMMLALLGLALSTPALAQWKWRDAQGQVLYSDRPPPQSVPEKDILQTPVAATRRIQVISSLPLGASAPAETASQPKVKAESKSDAEAEARRVKAEQEQAAKASADEQKNAAARSENCSRARGYLRSLESGLRITRTTETGEREILDDKQRSLEMQRARNVMNSDCAKP